ncbi:serine/threonine protein kinase [Cylindrospermopsis raciborskii S07]|uniref:serine/threonine-protein kinase n=1 Tax=Cylindrospermopsis raciborskii TaxID=77022 RepID=UPI000C9E4235|nr:serine/threonine-protein kinase [Cylindrospermopsis raciborskii]PNK01614.1 serine/threonine protein kinase [Cylindrospermopsis raciborskii S10]PNK05051.1 serine/threonine protein kinase [Cylindrospermopsis raciborskii S07]PNK05525.1 serine/threonine protein kinase [Cylindrospermopsis raciborskii S14]PNK12091.1 serine/threonine protein kinase [Cylindrospermopsis raciborskii S06]PNK13420.1 serine/threonine protein kinase [Cylindrospermopsis raciborskii S05]
MLITWQPGQSIVNDRFTIEEVLGVGGFGITYKAKDPKGELYAIKTLNPTIQNRVDFKEQQVKFINEALTVKGFRHPHIVKVYEVIQEGELFAVLMEYIKGIPLSKYIEENGQLTEVLALKYIDQISQALECVHKNNYLHRDIKPDNILLRNNYKDAVLIDFGLARIIATQSMTNSLTHGYAPIEQYQRRANFGPHTDVYALGATLYYVLTANGLRLKGESSPVPAVNRKYDEEELPEPNSYNPSISKKVNDAIMVAMAINPEQRTKNIEEFRKDLGLIESVESEVIPSRYTKLETLLKAQNFREADEETEKVMLAVANRQSEGSLRIEDAENFPCKELRTIDNLWLKYSQGKFGISVQQEIYKNLGGTKQFDVNVWDSFGDRVGWRKNGSWLDSYSDFNFSLSAPTGHLPAGSRRRDLILGMGFGDVVDGGSGFWIGIWRGVRFWVWVLYGVIQVYSWWYSLFNCVFSPWFLGSPSCQDM